MDKKVKLNKLNTYEAYWIGFANACRMYGKMKEIEVDRLENGNK